MARQRPDRPPRELEDEEIREISRIVQELSPIDLREFICRKKGALGALTGKYRLESLETGYECCLKVAAALIGQIAIDDNWNVREDEAVTLAYEYLSRVKADMQTNLPQLDS